MAQIFIVCALALSSFWLDQPPAFARKIQPSFVSRNAVCVDVAWQAKQQGMDPYLAVSVAYQETGFVADSVSNRGAVGPLQILRRWHGEGDPVAVGVRVLLRNKKIYGSWDEALCHYNAGNRCGRRSRYYARSILNRYRLQAGC